MPEPENRGADGTPDVRAIHQLVRLMKRYDLTAIDFVEGATQIRLRRRGPEAPVAAIGPDAQAAAAPPSPRRAAPPRPRRRRRPPRASDREPDGRDLLLLSSPTPRLRRRVGRPGR